MTAIDFKQQLRRQLKFLENSCNQYEHCEDEGIRIGTALRVLFHNTSQSTSLLSHLNGESINLLSSIQPEPGKRLWCPLVNTGFVLTLKPDFKATPKLDKANTGRVVAFDEWWDVEEVLSGNKSFNGSRHNLAKWAANKDGGAHVDASYPKDYLDVTRGFGFGVRVTAEISEDGTETTIPPEEQTTSTLQSLHLATLRQIGYEVLNSPELKALEH
jgi:hypothetical protein